MKHRKQHTKNMKNSNKTNNVVTFTTIEKTVATMTIGSKCTYAKYNDNRNGYIGIKCGRSNVISMFGLKNDNDTTTTKNVGVTNDIFKVLETEFKNTANVEFIANGNSGDSGNRKNKIIAPLETVYKMFEYIVKWYSTPTTTTK